MSTPLKGWTARLDPEGTLSLELARDRLRLEPWDQERVEVDLLAGAPELLELTGSPRKLRLGRRSGGGPMELVLRAPRHLHLRLEDDASRVTLGGFQGSFRLASGGRLDASGLEGELTLEAGGGEHRFEAFRGSFDVTCRGGRVALGIDEIRPSSRLVTRGGRVDVDLAAGVAASLETGHRSFFHSMTVRAELGSGGVPVAVKVRRGEIRWLREGRHMGTLKRNGEVRLAGWDRKRRRFFQELASRLQALG